MERRGSQLIQLTRSVTPRLARERRGGGNRRHPAQDTLSWAKSRQYHGTCTSHTTDDLTVLVGYKCRPPPSSRHASCPGHRPPSLGSSPFLSASSLGRTSTVLRCGSITPIRSWTLMPSGVVTKISRIIWLTLRQMGNCTGSCRLQWRSMDQISNLSGCL